MMNQNSYQSERMLMRQRQPESGYKQSTLEPPEIIHDNGVESSILSLGSGGRMGSRVVRSRNFYDTQKRADMKAAMAPRLPQ